MDEIKKSLDTYALVEIKRGNEKFINYLDSEFLLNDIILAEFYNVLLREEGEEIADVWLDKLERYSVSVERDILIEAVKFRHENKKTGMSFFDAVGYIFAKKNNCLFVTGDKEFENFSGVEFIKK